MQPPKQHWTPLDPAQTISMLTYFFGNGGSANTYVIKIPQGGLLIVSPGTNIPEEAFAELETMGTPTALLAPNPFHSLGLLHWHARYPNARCFAHTLSIKRIQKRLPSLPFEPLDDLTPILTPQTRIFQPPYIKSGELILQIPLPHGLFWITTDIILNLTKLPKNPIMRLIFWLSKSAPGLKLNRMFQIFFVKDRRQFKQWLIMELEQHPPVALGPGHGKPILDPTIKQQLIDLLRQT